jgi:hypothetical protein
MSNKKWWEVFIVVEDMCPEFIVECPECRARFFTSPHTEEGMRYDYEEKVLKVQCECGFTVD